MQARDTNRTEFTPYINPVPIPTRRDGTGLRSLRSLRFGRREAKPRSEPRVLLRGCITGFTAIELVVSLAIIMLIGGQVIISFSGLGQGVTLNRAVQELVGEIRKAQYAALAVVYAPQTGLPPSPAVGLRISIGGTPPVLRFIDRTDCPDCVQNGQYDSAWDEKIGEYRFPDNIRINRILDDQGNSYTATHILFQVPEASIRFTRDDGTAFPGNRMDIELTSSTGTRKTVTVRITGQINAR